ncbi:hypothetical protein HPB47_000741, partial [Ixodes persulcatus]
ERSCPASQSGSHVQPCTCGSCSPRRTSSSAQATGRSRSRWVPEGPRSRSRRRSRSVARLTLIRHPSK